MSRFFVRRDSEGRSALARVLDTFRKEASAATWLVRRWFARRAKRRSGYGRFPFLIIAVIALGLTGFQIANSKAWAAEKLAQEGYTNVTMTGWQPFTIWCGSREGIAQGFRGRDARGYERSGYVCSNLLFSYIVN